MQACLLHLIRNTVRYASRRDWDATGKQLRPIYTAPTAAAAGDRFAEFAEAWGRRYPGDRAALAVGRADKPARRTS